MCRLKQEVGKDFNKYVQIEDSNQILTVIKQDQLSVIPFKLD